MPDSMHIYYSPSYTSAEYGFETTRKATWVAESLIDGPIENVTLLEPRPLSESELLEIHSREYVSAVKTGTPRQLAKSSGFPWDPAVWESVTASNGGAVAAALRALDAREHAGSLSSGLHHARRGRGAAFCTFNGLAAAAKAAIRAGAERVLILDLDAHVDDGTLDIVRDWLEVIHVDIAVSAGVAPAGDPAGIRWTRSAGQPTICRRSRSGSRRLLRRGSTCASTTPGWIRTRAPTSAPCAG